MLNLALSKLMKLDFARFLVSGGFNTVLTYGIYLLLLLVIPYTASYTISYAIGILLAYILNRFFVFKSHRGLQSALLLPLIYGIQYGLSMLILWFWVEKFDLDERLAPIAAVVITFPITYIFSKIAFSDKAKNIAD
ncbi:GtrA family protein [Pseudomonas sp. LP_7_YM]|uniref:GtrA family protein n=1 Tax=Pseudomonas sp. LP_7_YM TaxID=2485137 RepID=UPI00105D46C0|nr:GtrA family protein [Pseudomonas sp. LP_7_YM]TDV61894.1 putative flippase GtrA [Pseudomonas sp. LP_7_YM]